MTRVYIESYGCSLNLSEGEVMAGLLSNSGHKIADAPENADALIVNMCSVKTPTERKILKRVRELSTLKRPLIVAGCLPIGGKTALTGISPCISLVNTQNLHRIAEAVDTVLGGNHIEYLTKEKHLKLGLPKLRRNPVVGIIPISDGCDLACSYCVTTAIKGPLLSYPAKDIREEMTRGYSDGVREFWLTSQDNGAYYTERLGRCMLPSLLNGIAKLDGEFRVRVGMMNPRYIIEVLDGLAESFADERFFRFFHIPVQAGSDHILKEMRRGYTADDFLNVAGAFRERYPESTLSTDVICGFPGESDVEFEETLALLREVKPDVLNISRFWPRPGTRAARMPDQLHGSVTKERSSAAARLFAEISKERCAAWEGWQGTALVDELGTKKGTVIARNNAYRPIVLKGTKAMLGKFVQVKVTGAGPHYLLGKLLR